jgi:hypothetical protein
MQSAATTVPEYLESLPADRRDAIAAVRATILANIDADIEEGMQYGMIGYYVPHRVYPAGYHVNPALPLPYVSLASQKQYMSLYLMTSYMEPGAEQWLREAFAAAGKKLNMGKCCIRFRKLDDLPLEVVGEAIRRAPSATHIAHYSAALAAPKVPRPGKRK